MRLWIKASAVLVCSSGCITSTFAHDAFPVERVPSQTIAGYPIAGYPIAGYPIAGYPIAAYPIGAFLESVVVSADSSLLIVEHTNHDVIRMSSDGAQEAIVHLPDGAAGLALDLNGTVLVTGGHQNGDGFVTVLDPSGAVRDFVQVHGTRFLNGGTQLRRCVFLVTYSITASLYEVDIRTRTASVGLAHPLLEPNPDGPHNPGINSVKIPDCAVYVTNSGLAHVLRSA